MDSSTKTYTTISIPSFHGIMLEPYILTNLILIIGSALAVTALKLLLSVLEPMSYELDMTKKRFCKQVASIDNSLKLTSAKNIINAQNNETSKVASSLTEQFDEEANSVDTNNNSPDTVRSHAHPEESDHVYPNGWIPLVESYKVKPGTVKKAIIFGQDVIVTRSADGKQVNVLDAYCPHMGVHIGVGGRVKQVDNESCVECPFHGWTFRASDGLCVKIPYQKSDKCRIPKQAKLSTWQSVEVDNFIYVWHHRDHQKPDWSLEPSEQLSNADWQLIGRSCHLTNLELRDMHENGADMNHFEGIHNDVFILGGDIIKVAPLKHLQKYVRHHWRPEWKPILNDFGKMTHLARMKLQSWISLFNLRLFDITVNATQVGPARVNLLYDSKWYGSGLLIMNAVPMGGRRTKYIQHIYTRRNLFQCFMAKWVLYGEILMLERDFFIWNHKKNIKSPIFIPEDKTLKQFRLWYSQFYKRKITIQNEAKHPEAIENSTIPRCGAETLEF